MKFGIKIKQYWKKRRVQVGIQFKINWNSELKIGNIKRWVHIKPNTRLIKIKSEIRQIEREFK